MLGVRGMTMAAALTFGAVLWWATRGTEPAAEGFARLREAPASHADAFTANAWVAAAVRDESTAAPPRDESREPPSDPDAGFTHYIEWKYRFLLASPAHSSRGNEALRAALRERERIMVAINTARQGHDAEARAALPLLEAQLAGEDQRIAGMLPADEIAAFQALKDSQIEQFQMDDYAAGISNVAPLADAQRRDILFSKLTYRQRFREVLEQSGLLHEGLAPGQRQAALAVVTQALRQARDGFLYEARQHLADEQYGLLANYENGEYSAELEKLRQMAGGG